MMNGNVENPERNVRQMSSDDNVIHMSYDNLVPGEYEKRVIFGNMCSSLAGMRCIFDGTDADIFYITTGLCRFDGYVEREAVNMQRFLSIILNVLIAVRNCGNYLISENELSLRAENIFFSEMNEEVKLLYIPGYRRDSPLGAEIVGLVGRAEKICRFGVFDRDSVAQYSASIIDAENDVYSMISLTEEAMRMTYISAAAYNAEGASAAEKGAPMAAEAPAEYGGKKVKHHIRDFINELVS